jgi:hypothetical protein
LHAPSAFVSIAAALAIAGVQRSLSGRVATLAVLAGEVVAGALAMGLSIRFGPLRSTRRELWQRLTAAGALGTAEGLRSRLAPFLIGPPAPEMTDARP